MSDAQRISQVSLQSFLARHQTFGLWREDWVGVPIESRTYLSDELPPRHLVGSVRAMILRGDEVLLVHSSPPLLNVGGRCELGETIEQTLLREVGEETGWLVTPIAVLGFTHHRHVDEQRPDWGRPAPNFIDPMFAVTAVEYDSSFLGVGETRSKFISIQDVAQVGIVEIEQTFLREALRKRSKLGDC